MSASGATSGHGLQLPMYHPHMPQAILPPSNSYVVASSQDQPLPSLPSPPPPSLPGTAVGSSKIRTLHLAGGVTVTFSGSDVGPPPATTFASDIDLLNRMWDDTSEHWGKFSHLVIKDKYIPIVYWKQVYSRWPSGDGTGSHLWRSIKNQYSQWKVRVFCLSLSM